MRSPWHCQATIQGVNDRSPPPQPEVASAATYAPQPLQTAPHHASATLAAPVTHYENFPVASLLCPPHLRQPIAAIYGFARTADDIADEGDACWQTCSAPLPKMLKKPVMPRDTLTAPSCWTTAAAQPTPWAGCCCTCTA